MFSSDARMLFHPTFNAVIYGLPYGRFSTVITETFDCTIIAYR